MMPGLIDNQTLSGKSMPLLTFPLSELDVSFSTIA